MGKEILTECELIVTSGCDSSRQHRHASPFSLRLMLLEQLATDNFQIRSENTRKNVTRSSRSGTKNQSRASPEKKCFCTTLTKSFSPNASENETRFNQTRSLANQMNLGFSFSFIKWWKSHFKRRFAITIKTFARQIIILVDKLLIADKFTPFVFAKLCKRR